MDEDYSIYLGHPRKCFLGYSTNQEYRKNAASGGVATTLLSHLLEEDIIDGALVSQLVFKDQDYQVRSFIASSKKELLNCQSSIYIDFNLPEAFQEIFEREGKYAVVALPCQIRILHKLMEENPELKKKIKLVVGLFCGHTDRPQTLDLFLEKKSIDKGKVEEFTFRKGHWRGRLHIKTREKELAVNYHEYGVLHNMWYFTPQKCLYCSDHTSELADISLGDAWLSEMKENPIKNNLILTRTVTGEKTFTELIRRNLVQADEIDCEKAFQAQKRILHLKKRGLNARLRIMDFFNLPKGSENNFNPLPNDYISSSIILLNQKVGKNRLIQKIIIVLPWQIHYLYLLLLSFLINY